MSQRKEKYLRHSLEQYNGVARDVGHLMKTVPVMNRDLHQVRDAQAAMDRRAAQDVRAIYAAMERSEKRTRRAIRRENRAARVASRLAILAALVAVLALILALRTAAQANEPAQAAEERAVPTATSAGFTPLVVIPETLAPAAQAVDGEDPLEDEKITEALLGQGYLSDAIPLDYTDQDLLRTACEEFGVPYTLAVAMVEKESRFHGDAIGDGGHSIGFLQIQQRFHTDRMAKLGVTDLMDHAGNFRVGLSYLAELLERYEDTHKALMAYNMGPSGASKLWEVGTYQSAYSREIMERAEYWAGVLEG